MKKAGRRALPSWNGNACYFFGAAVSDFIAPVAGAAGAAGVAGAAAIAGAAASAFGFDIFAGGGVLTPNAEFDDDDAFCIDF